MPGYIVNTQTEQQLMLESIGLKSFEELYTDVPENIKLKRPLSPENGKTEREVTRILTELSEQNTVFKHIYRGAGAYRHFIPSVVPYVVNRAEFVTAYTPYQAEMSQGILQAIFEYQTAMCRLTGMDVSNASHYDGATAAAEAIVMCKKAGSSALLFGNVNPQVARVISTYADGVGIKIVTANKVEDITNVGNISCVLMAYPDYFGNITDIEMVAQAAHSINAKLIVYANPIALGLLEAPGNLGADIVCGEGQPLGMSMNFGGPYLGFITCKTALARQLPGRIVGQTTDDKGRRAFVLTLQAREQHIRREKASSSICSNQALCALTALAYLSCVGPFGLKEAALLCYSNAHTLSEQLESLGFRLANNGEFFHEFETTCPIDFTVLETACMKNSVLPGLRLENGNILWCATELNDDNSALISAILEVSK